jgi:hypothetical protein
VAGGNGRAQGGRHGSYSSLGIPSTLGKIRTGQETPMNGNLELYQQKLDSMSLWQKTLFAAAFLGALSALVSDEMWKKAIVAAQLSLEAKK